VITEGGKLYLSRIRGIPVLYICTHIYHFYLFNQ